MARYTLGLCLVAVVAAAAMTAVEGHNTTTTTSAAQASITASTTTMGATTATTTCGTDPAHASDVPACQCNLTTSAKCKARFVFDDNNVTVCFALTGGEITATYPNATVYGDISGESECSGSSSFNASTVCRNPSAFNSSSGNGTCSNLHLTTQFQGVPRVDAAMCADSTQHQNVRSSALLCCNDGWSACAPLAPASICKNPADFSQACLGTAVTALDNVEALDESTCRNHTLNNVVNGGMSTPLMHALASLSSSCCGGSPTACADYGFNASTVCRNPSAFNSSSGNGTCSNLHMVPQFQGVRRVDAAMCADPTTQVNVFIYADMCCSDGWSACTPLAPASICKNPADFDQTAFVGQPCGVSAGTALINVAAVDESTCLNQSVNLPGMSSPMPLVQAAGTISPSCCGGGASVCADYAFNASTVCHNPSAFNIGKDSACPTLASNFQGLRVDAAMCADSTQHQNLRSSALLCCNDGWSACAPLAPASICKNPANFSQTCLTHAVTVLDNVAALDESTCRNHSVDVPDMGTMPLAQVLGSVLSDCCGGGTMACADYAPTPAPTPAAAVDNSICDNDGTCAAGKSCMAGSCECDDDSDCNYGNNTNTGGPYCDSGCTCTYNSNAGTCAATTTTYANSTAAATTTTSAAGAGSTTTTGATTVTTTPAPTPPPPDPLSWTGAQAQTEAALVEKVGTWIMEMSVQVSNAQMAQANANYDLWNTTCNNGTLFPVYKCYKPDNTTQLSYTSQSSCETNNNGECSNSPGTSSPQSSCTGGTCNGTDGGMINGVTWMGDRSTCENNYGTYVPHVWTPYAWKSMASSAWTSETRCKNEHGSDVNDMCCSDGQLKCEKDASGEEYGNAGIYKCANDCNPGNSEYSDPPPAHCNTASILSDYAALRAGTKNRTRGPIKVCAQVPKCGTCMNAGKYPFSNRRTEQSECGSGDKAGACTYADGTFVGKESFKSQSQCENKGACSTDVASDPSGYSSSTVTECASKGTCKRPSDNSDQGSDQSSCTGGVCFNNDSNDHDIHSDNATCISKGNCSSPWNGTTNGAFTAAHCNGTFTPNVWEADVWQPATFTPTTWVPASFVTNNATTETSCEEETTLGGAKCMMCNTTWSACSMSYESCLGCSISDDPNATIVDVSATYTTEDACTGGSSNNPSGIGQRFWKGLYRFEPEYLHGSPLTADGDCNDSTGGKLVLTGDLSSSLLQHIGFTNRGFTKDTLLMSDLRAGTTAAAAYAANKIYYDNMMNWKTASGSVVAARPPSAPAGAISAEIELKLSGVTIFQFPEVAGKFATAACSGATCNNHNGVALTAADLHVIAIEPLIHASSDPSVGLVVSNGDVTVHGGENRGNIVASTTGAVRLYGMTNGPTGDITASNSQNIFVVSTTNQGSLEVSNVAAGLYDVTSSGDIHCDGCKAKAWKTTNTAGGTITVTGAAKMTLADSSNAGTITINASGGIFQISGSNNTATGTINVVAGRIEADNVCNTGTVTVAAGVTGYINHASACTGGNITVPAGFSVSDDAGNAGTTTTTPAGTTTGATTTAPTSGGSSTNHACTCSGYSAGDGMWHNLVAGAEYCDNAGSCTDKLEGCATKCDAGATGAATTTTAAATTTTSAAEAGSTNTTATGDASTTTGATPTPASPTGSDSSSFNASTVCRNPQAFDASITSNFGPCSDVSSLPEWGNATRVTPAMCSRTPHNIMHTFLIAATGGNCCSDSTPACATLDAASICENPARFNASGRLGPPYTPTVQAISCAVLAHAALSGVASINATTCSDNFTVPNTAPFEILVNASHFTRGALLGLVQGPCCGGTRSACPVPPTPVTQSPTPAPTQPPPLQVETTTLVKKIALKPVAVQGINCTQARALLSMVENATRFRLGLSATQLVTASVQTCSNARRRLLAKEATYDQNITEIVKIVITTLANGTTEVDVTKMDVNGAEIPQSVNVSSITAMNGNGNITAAAASAMYTAEMETSEAAIIATANTSTTADALVAEITTIVKENAPGLTEAEKSAITANLTGSFVSYEIVEEVVVVTPAPTPSPTSAPTAGPTPSPTDTPTTPGATFAPTTSPSYAIDTLGDEFLDGVTRFEPWPALLLVVVTLNLVVLRLGEPV